MPSFDQNIVPDVGMPDISLPNSVSDAVGNRLAIANLAPVGDVANAPQAGQTKVIFGSSGKEVGIEQDWRIRVSINSDATLLYASGTNGILQPLAGTQGVVFPYVPTITTSYVASYGQQKTTHSNYPAYFYESSEVSAINISGEFTVQNLEEGKYLLACIYFFRAASKMYFGAGSNAGNPPPILYLDGYGSHYFPHVPCVLTNFQHVMGGEVDYIEVPSGEGTTRMPTASQIQISLQPVYSRLAQTKFDLDAFARGDLIKDKGGFL